MNPEDILKSFSHVEASASPFFDRAEDFPLSNWMMAYALGEGVDDMDEFYLGGLPDLSSVSNIQQVADALQLKKTKFYKLFRKYLEGRVLIDLGCGIPSLSTAPRMLAKLAGAEGYMGIDLQHIESNLRREEFLSQTSFWSLFLKSDNIKFLESLKDAKNLCFLLSGIELKEMDSSQGKNYCSQLLKLIVDKMDRKSLLILCVSSRDFSPTDFGLKLIYSDPHHEFFVKKGIIF